MELVSIECVHISLFFIVTLMLFGQWIQITRLANVLNINSEHPDPWLDPISWEPWADLMMLILKNERKSRAHQMRCIMHFSYQIDILEWLNVTSWLLERVWKKARREEGGEVMSWDDSMYGMVSWRLFVPKRTPLSMIYFGPPFANLADGKCIQ